MKKYKWTEGPCKCNGKLVQLQLIYISRIILIKDHWLKINSQHSQAMTRTECTTYFFLLIFKSPKLRRLLVPSFHRLLSSSSSFFHKMTFIFAFSLPICLLFDLCFKFLEVYSILALPNLAQLSSALLVRCLRPLS